MSYPKYLSVVKDYPTLFQRACDAFERGRIYEALAETRKMFVVDAASGFRLHQIVWCDHLPGLRRIQAGIVQFSVANDVVYCSVQLEQLRSRTWSPHGLCHAINLVMHARALGMLRVPQLLFDTGGGSYRGTPAKISFCSASPTDTLVMDPEFALTQGYLTIRGAIPEQTAWRERIDKIIWRGSTTGQWLQPAIDDQVQGRWDWLQRLKLCHAAAISCHAPFMDIGISSVVQLDRDRALAVRSSGFMRASIKTAEFGRYRYAVDIDGNANAWSGLFTKLLMGCCVLKVESPLGFRQWYYPKMRPWEHYAPVKADLSDLDEIVERLLLNPGLGEMIAAQGQALAEEITLEGSLNEAMDAIAALPNDVPDVIAPPAKQKNSSVTEDDVVWCYRSLLRREPESQEVVSGLVEAADDFRSLVMLFLASTEYHTKTAPSSLVPLPNGQMNVEAEASEPPTSE